jgi:hypothetical protein
MTCEKCIYHTCVKVNKSKVLYNALLGCNDTYYIDINVPACGYNVGNPVEIPVDRVPCFQRKEEAKEDIQEMDSHT